MKYLNYCVVALVAVLVVGCASAPKVVVVDPVGPVPQARSYDGGEGTLVVYSARVPAYPETRPELWGEVFDPEANASRYEAANSGYTIYSRDGKVIKQVRNGSDESSGAPTLVSLKPGSYTVEAEAVNCDARKVKAVLVAVIKPGQTTVVHLQGGWMPGREAGQADLATLPCGRPIGWRAPRAGVATAD